MKSIYCFDIDGTLLSSKGAGSRSFKKAICSLFGTFPPWDSISMAGRLDPAIFKDILDQLGQKFTDAIWEEFKKSYISYLQEEALDTSKWIVFKGVSEILKKLKEKNKKIILMTGNIREGAKLKIKSVGLNHYFDWEGSVFGDDGREHRDELALIYKKKHNHRHTPIIIGDTPFDINIAKILGGVSVAVTTGIYPSEELGEYSPDYLLESLIDFPWDGIE